MKTALIGVGIGIGGALALTRVMERMLYEIKPTTLSRLHAFRFC